MHKWVMLVAVLFAGAALADGNECPLPEIRLRGAALGDRWADFARSREVVRSLIAAAQRDAAGDRSLVGSELSALGADSRLVTFEVLSLAIRLRQLDCAAWRGRDVASLYGTFVDDARALLASLDGAEKAAREYRPLPELLIPDRPHSAAGRAVGRYISGGFGIGFGLALAAGALGISLDLGQFSHRSATIGADASLWVMAAGSVATGVIMIARGRRAAHSSRPR